ncbi:hypothetical protein Pfo_026503 [Paulownia fortunei]|nr:hypothetical protein Pfo_026503 [Paulownia fortunei]
MYPGQRLFKFRHRRRAPPQLDGNPLVQLANREIPPPKILKRRDLSDTALSKLKSLPRFGPLHRGDEPYFSSMKEEAWQLVLTKSGPDESVTMETYVSAMGRIEQEARNSYADELIDHLTGSEFRLMMIKDGCFFLHLALLLVGASVQLGYPGGHGIFGRARSKRDIKRWMEAMLFVGNQIPIVVLKELMKLSFFQQVITDKRKWEQPQGIFRRTLYELLGLPAVGGVANNCFVEKSVDLLHGLQCLVLGSGPKPNETERNDDVDLESGGEDSSGIDDGQRFLSATEMEQAGIGFKRGAAGAKGIKFSTNIFQASLCLPAFLVDEDTELVFQSLIDYETCQEPLNKNKCKVSSYLRLMKDIVRSPEDIKLLEKRGIIALGSLEHKEMLAGILDRLDCKDYMTPELHTVRLLTSNYCRPVAWGELKSFFSIVVILTALQTFYTIYSYHHPHDSHQ